MTEYDKPATKSDVYAIACGILAFQSMTMSLVLISLQDYLTAAWCLFGTVGFILFWVGFENDGRIRSALEYEL